MKRVLITLLAVLFALGLLGAAGFAGYRIGFNQGVQVPADGDAPFLGPRGFGIVPHRMPMHNFEFHRGFGPGGFGMMDRSFGFGFGFFPWFGLLLRLLFWGFLLWAIYLLVTRSGWHLTRTPPVTQTPPAPAVEENRV